MGVVAPKQFLCKSDEFATEAASATNKDGRYFLNFQSPRNFSYSSIYPWTMAGNKVVASTPWHNTMDASLPIMSDMAPYLGKTAEDVAPGPDTAAEKWVMTHANSQNHNFDGQNVGYGDAHVEFTRAPNVGEGGDSMWGIRKNPAGNARTEQPIAAGTLPHPPGGVMGDWDAVMVPTRDGKGQLK